MNGFVDQGVDYEVAQPRSSGHTAGRAGQPFSACPWKPGTLESREWTAAWIGATYDRRAEAGEVGATADEKTAAGLPAVDTEKGFGYCDPRVHEMWRPDLGGFAVKGFAAPVSGSYDLRLHWNLDPLISDPPTTTVTVTFSPEDTERLMRAFGIEGIEIEAVLDDPGPKARALARKRRPFTCHRHGQQPGGFCRTCQRGAR